MPHLAISLLGALRVAIDQHAVQSFPTTKSQALLAYLAVERDRAHDRAMLATLLWPDQPPRRARNNLRQTLFRLRQVLGDQQEAQEPFFLLTRTTVQFNENCSHWLDVAQFATAVRETSPASPEAPLQQLTQATTLFQGDFLEHIALGDSAEFEAWATVQRQWYRRHMLNACHRLAAHHLAAGQLAVAQEFAWRQVALEPLREEGHRQVMEVLAWRGQRSAAVAQYEKCAALLAEELDVAPDAETEQLYQQIISGAWPPVAPEPTTAVRTQSVPSTIQTAHAVPSLPLHPTPFVGYEEEQKQLLAMLQRGDCRLLTVTGLVGVGKSALALQVAHAVQAEQKRPSVWLDVSSMTTAVAFEEQLATIDLQTLSANNGLLLLDGFDQLVPHAAVLTDLLRRAPQLTLLVTARQRLNLPAEWVFDLVGLAYPDPILAEAWQTLPSVQLFWQTARRVNSDLYLTHDDWLAIADICRLLEGHPLGIELAAQWTRLMRCATIARELRDNLHLLTTADMTHPTQPQSLTATLAAVWQTLSTAEQVALQRLALFPAGFGREAAARVAEVSHTMLLRLLDASLLRRITTDFYRMPPILRHFVHEEQALDAAEQTAAQRRYVAFYLPNVLARQAAALGGAGNEQEAVLVRLRREWDNVLQAWRWLKAHPAPAEWDTAVEVFTLLCEKLGEQESGLALLTAVSRERPASEQPVWRLARGWLMLLAGQGATGRRLVEQVATAVSAETNPRLARRVYTILARLLLATGETEAAERYCRPALALCQQEQDHEGAALTLLVAARLALQEGAHGRAEKLAIKSQSLWQRLHNRWRLAETLLLLADVAQAQGDWSRAHNALLPALKLWQGMLAYPHMSVCWQRLGELARLRGDVPQARRWYESLRTAAQATGQPHEAVTAGRALGQLARQEKNYSRAHAAYQQAVQVAMRHQLRPQMTVLLVELGELWGEAQWVGMAEKHAPTPVMGALSPDVERLVQHFFGQLMDAAMEGRQLTTLATAVVQAFLGPEESRFSAPLDDLLTELEL